jgi:hypothetical protein
MAGNFNVHHIKDMFEPVGDVEKWVNRFNDAHEGTFSDGDTWDAFMSLGMGYFTPYLKDHLVRWVKNDLPHRAHYYKNTVDGSTMYVITTYNPNTGNVLEIHGTAVSDDDDENTEMIAKHFTKTPSGACELALCLGLSTDHLQQAWDDDSFNHYYAAGHGLPFAAVAKISHPTNAADDVVTWMTNNAQLDFTVAESDSGLCRIAHKSIKKYKDTGYAHVMFVEDTRSSAADDEDVKLRPVPDARAVRARQAPRHPARVGPLAGQPPGLHVHGRSPRRHRPDPGSEWRGLQGLPRRVQDGQHLRGVPQLGLLRLALVRRPLGPGGRVPLLLRRGPPVLQRRLR